MEAARPGTLAPPGSLSPLPVRDGAGRLNALLTASGDVEVVLVGIWDAIAVIVIVHVVGDAVVVVIELAGHVPAVILLEPVGEAVVVVVGVVVVR